MYDGALWEEAYDSYCVPRSVNNFRACTDRTTKDSRHQRRVGDGILISFSPSPSGTSKNSALNLFEACGSSTSDITAGEKASDRFHRFSQAEMGGPHIGSSSLSSLATVGTT